MTQDLPQPLLSWEQQEMFRILRSVPGSVYQEASEPQRMEIRNWILDVLRNNHSVVIEFVKSNGTLRQMNCTLHNDVTATQDLPAGLTPTPHPAVKKARDPETQTVWDNDLNQWRSFRYDRLKKVTVTLELDK